MYVARKHPHWKIVVKSWRGLNCPITSPKPETWGPQAVDDLSCAIESIRGEYPDAPLLGTGFSYGGQLVLCHMGQRGLRKSETLDAGINVSGLFDMTAVGENMHGTIYDYVNMSNMYMEGVYECMPAISAHLKEGAPRHH